MSKDFIKNKEAFIDSMNRIMNNDDDDTSRPNSSLSLTRDTDTNNSKPLNKNQIPLSLSYKKRINDLLENNPNSEYGHFESYANAIYCHDCQMMLQPKYISRIPCKVPEVVVQQDGTVIYVHSKCEKLDLTKYIQSLATETGSLRETYWQIWSECHFLTCMTCKFPYPVRNSAMCQYHPEIPEYFPIGNSGLQEQPIGRYPCCGERAFRFELIKNPFGCKFRFHIPNKDNVYSGRIVKLMCNNLDLTVAHPPALNRESKINLDPGIKRPNDQHWWVKLTLGANGYTHQPIISRKCNFLTGQKKLKKRKDLKGNLSEESEMTYIQDLQREQESFFFDQITVNHVKPIKRVKFFDQITVNHVKPIEGVKGSPGTPDQLRDSYTPILKNMLAKIEAQNKSTNLKPAKSCKGVPSGTYDAPPVFTKRGVLSLLARIFDPLGLFAPATFYAKRIMQRTWSSNLGWDDKLPNDIRQNWATFVEACLLPIKIPRHFNTRSSDRCLL